MGNSLSIRVCREQANLTQQQLADSLGVRKSTVCRWELGKREPGANRVLALANAIGCTIDALFGREPPGPGAAAS